MKDFRKRLESILEYETLGLYISAVLALIVAAYLLWGFGWNIYGFFRIGSVLPLSPHLNAEKVLVYDGELGYDGQVFLSIALDPGLRDAGTVEALDNPSYRYRRILYPLMGYVLSFGCRTLVPYTMVLINILCIVFLTQIVGSYLSDIGIPRTFGLLVLAVPGVWMVLSLGTGDLLAGSLLLAAFLAFRRRQTLLCVLALALACLARDVMAAMVAGFVAAAVLSKRFRTAVVLPAAVIPVVAWNIYVRTQLGAPTNRLTDSFGAPFVGIFRHLGALFDAGLNVKTMYGIYTFVLLIAIIVLLAVIAYMGRRENPALFACAGIVVLMFIFARTALIGYYIDSNRVFMVAYLLLLLGLHRRMLLPVLLMYGLAGMASAAYIAAYGLGII